MSLLDHVLADPDSDAPRLVYADWLLEQPNAIAQARGEFIQIQCRLAALPDEASPERTALVRREAALLARYERAWIAAAIPAALNRRRAWDATGGRFERGFIAELVVDDVGKSLPHLPALLAKLPLQRLHVWCHVPGDLAALLAAPGLEQLRELTLGISDGACADPIAPLLTTRRLDGLRRLGFAWHRSLRGGIDAPVAAVLAAPLAANVTQLELALPGHDESNIAHAVAAALDSPCAGQLEALRVRARERGPIGATPTPIGSAAIDRLCSAHLPNLRALALDGTEVAVALPALADRAGLPALTAIELAGGRTTWNVADVARLARRTPLTGLALVAYQRRPDFKSLLALEELGELRSLALGFPFDDTAAAALAKASHLRHLRALALRESPLTGAGANAIASAPHLASLRTLELVDNRSTSVVAFTKSPYLAGLARLDLRRSGVARSSPAVAALRERFGAAAIITDDDDLRSPRRI